MATFAKLDNNNYVVNIFKINDVCCWDENLTEHESLGIEYCKVLFNEPEGKFVQVSIGSRDGVHTIQTKQPIKKRLPVKGDYYDETRDAFIQKPDPWDSPSNLDANGNPIYSQSDYFFDEGTCRWLLNGTVYVLPKTYPNERDFSNACAQACANAAIIDAQIHND